MAEAEGAGSPAVRELFADLCVDGAADDPSRARPSRPAHQIGAVGREAVARLRRPSTIVALIGATSGHHLAGAFRIGGGQPVKGSGPKRPHATKIAMAR
jgi:hypothetical protein